MKGCETVTRARKEEIREMYDRLFVEMTDLASYRNRLEEIGCKKEAALLDTVTGKLFSITEKLADKMRKP